MANINLTQQGLNQLIEYNINGVDLNRTIELSFDPVDNPIIFEFESSPTGVVNTIPAEIRLSPNADRISIFPDTIFSNVSDGDSYTIQKEIFTASSQPTKNGFFSGPPGDGELIVSSLADAINQNTSLNWQYVAISTTEFDSFGNTVYYVLLKAKYPGSLFNFSNNISFIFQTNQNPVYANISSLDESRGQQLQGYNYSAFIEIWKYDNSDALHYGFGREPQNSWGEPKLITTLKQNWNSSNKFVFDVSKYLKSSLEPYQPVEDDIFEAEILTDNLYGAYFIKYGEEFIGGFDKNTQLPIDFTNKYSRKYYIGQTSVKWFGYGIFELNVIPSPNSRYWNYYVTSPGGPLFYSPIKILSRQPEYKLRRRFIPFNISNNFTFFDNENIFFVLHNSEYLSSNITFRLNSVYTFVDGTTSQPIYSHLLNTLGRNGIAKFNLSSQNLDFLSVDTPNKRVLHSSHTIQINTLIGGSIGYIDYSEPITYQWDLNLEPIKYVQLYWENEFGVLDQFSFEGNIIEKLNINSTTYQSNFENDEGIWRNTPTNKIFKQLSTDKTTYNTGWIDESHYNWLKSLLRSNRVYKNKPDNFESNKITPGIIDLLGFDNLYQAVNIIDFNWEKDKQEFLYNLTITITEAIEENTREQ